MRACKPFNFYDARCQVQVGSFAKALRQLEKAGRIILPGFQKKRVPHLYDRQFAPFFGCVSSGGKPLGFNVFGSRLMGTVRSPAVGLLADFFGVIVKWGVDDVMRGFPYLLKLKKSKYVKELENRLIAPMTDVM